MSDINNTIKNNVGLVMNQLSKMHVTFDPDAESIGYEALYNAALTYDPSKGAAFSTYATCCIYNALGSYIRTMRKKRQLDTVSYNAIAFSEDGSDHEFLDFLTDHNDAEKCVMRQELNHKVLEVYKIVYKSITNDKHSTIIQAWHESDYCMSNKELADRVGVSQPYVNQIINTFKHNVRKKMEAYYNG